jgi:hypothetical protein
MAGECEAPAIYLRWAAISGLGAVIGRNAYIKFGHKKLYPNNYIMLVGRPGSRKGTGIDIVKDLLRSVTYTNLAPSRCRKEAFWEAMAEFSKVVPMANPNIDVDDMTFDNILSDTEYATGLIYVLAPELEDFLSPGDDEFIANLTNLWDNLDNFPYKRTTKASIHIHEPTVNLLAGTTPSSFTRIIPAHAIGGGFSRRLLLIYGEQTKKVTQPDELNVPIFKKLHELFQAAMQLGGEQVTVTQAAWKLLEVIYKREHFLTDRRFDTYLSVRLTHLLKLCIIAAISRYSTEVTEEDVVHVNTILSVAEMRMPQALGHFGIARTSAVDSIIIEAIRNANRPLDLSMLHKNIGADIGSRKELKERLENLKAIDKISVQVIKGKPCYVVLHDMAEMVASDPYVDQSILTQEERV